MIHKVLMDAMNDRNPVVEAVMANILVSWRFVGEACSCASVQFQAVMVYIAVEDFYRYVRWVGGMRLVVRGYH